MLSAASLLFEINKNWELTKELKLMFSIVLSYIKLPTILRAKGLWSEQIQLSADNSSSRWPIPALVSSVTKGLGHENSSMRELINTTGKWSTPMKHMDPYLLQMAPMFVQEKGWSKIDLVSLHRWFFLVGKQEKRE